MTQEIQSGWKLCFLIKKRKGGDTWGTEKGKKEERGREGGREGQRREGEKERDGGAFERA